MAARYDAVRALSEGWSLYRAAPLWCFLGALLVRLDAPTLGIGVDVGRVEDALRGASSMPEVALVVASFLVPALGGGLALLAGYALLRAWITGGWLRWLDGAGSGSPAEGALIFSGGRDLGPVLVVQVLTGAAVFAGAGLAAAPAGAVALVILPGRSLGDAALPAVALALAGGGAAIGVAGWLSARLLFADVLVVLGGLSPAAAVSRSWEITAPGGGAPPALWLLGMVGAAVAAALLGLALCCVGVLFTMTAWGTAFDLGRVRLARALENGPAR